MNYLYAAYIIVWVVLIGYIIILTRGFKKLAEEMKELER
ncbi:MAG: CcmD family protein [Terriglobales bacterium]